MKQKLLVCLMLLLSGCTTYKILPENITYYDRGIKILDSQEVKSKVQVEISQNDVGGFRRLPFVIYVGAQIQQGRDVLFDIDSLVATQNGVIVPILDYRQVLDSDYNFVEVLQDFSITIPVSTLINNNFVTPPFLYYGRGSFLTYNILFNPFPFNNVQELQIIQEQRQARKIFAMNYLRKSTLSADNFGEKAKGGFVAIRSKNIKEGNLLLKVLVGDETHLFKINIQKSN